MMAELWRAYLVLDLCLSALILVLVIVLKEDEE